MAKKAQRMRKRNREIVKHMQARGEAMRDLVQQQSRELGRHLHQCLRQMGDQLDIVG